MSIHLRTLSETDVQTLLNATLPGEVEQALLFVLPPVVLTASLDSLDQGIPWFWAAPRLFMLDALPIGSTAFMPCDLPHQYEVGYGTASPWQGRGFATMGLGLLIFDALQADPQVRLLARTSVTNPASARVLEKNHFVRYDQTTDPTDGTLDLWRLETTVFSQKS